MGRSRVNPFDQGTAERTLFERFRKKSAEASAAQRYADMYRVEAEAARAAADRYAAALRALGHGDKLPQEPYPALPPPPGTRKEGGK